MKRTLCILLSLVLTLTGLAALCVSAHAAYKTGDVIEYGCYPQTLAEDNVNLHNAALKAQFKSYRYWYGNGQYNTIDGALNVFRGDFMMYADFDYHGERYRAVRFTEYRPASTILPCIKVYSYQDDNGFSTNQIYIFKYEPLKWRVLDPQTGLILCDSIIDAQAFRDFVDKYGSEYFASAVNGIYANNYHFSTIRDWLNQDFYDTAFNAAQKENIKITTFDETCNDPSQLKHMFPSSDKVFLLSEKDAKDPAYGFAPSATAADDLRRAKGTEYAKCQGLFCSSDDTAFWWLRTCGQTSHYVHNVSFDSYVHGAGYYENSGPYVEDTYIGVRPACCLNELKDDTAQIGGVNAVSVSDLKINYKASAELNPQFTADEGAAYTVQYASSDDNVVKIDENGKLYGAKKGTAEVTVTVTDKYGHTVTDKCKITVKYSVIQWLIMILLFGWIWY